MTERQIAIVGLWAIATDGVQWIVQRYRGGRWRNISFIHSTRTVLARCLHEAGATPAEIHALLGGFHARFEGEESGLDGGSVRQNELAATGVAA
jgi:hypothetical protein